MVIFNTCVCHFHQFSIELYSRITAAGDECMHLIITTFHQIYRNSDISLIFIDYISLEIIPVDSREA